MTRDSMENSNFQYKNFWIHWWNEYHFKHFNALQFNFFRNLKIHPKNPKIPGIHPIHDIKLASKRTYEGEQLASLYSKDFIIIKFSNIVDALTLLALKGSSTDNIQISGIFHHKILLKCSLLI